MRYFLDIAYLGTAFHGWQVQPNAVTVQEKINHALTTLLQTPTECVGSGRTDAGVHASQQIAHLDAEIPMPLDQFQYRLNGFLPPEISINGIYPVIPEAHARFDAESRTYHYYIHRYKNPFLIGRSYHFNRTLQLDRIRDAVSLFSGWKNFQAFSKVHTDVNHFDCQIFSADWIETNEGYVFSVCANRFLRGMVRAVVGTLLEVGQERISLNQLEDILKSGDRARAGRSAPAEGLFLTEVKYPKYIYLVN